VASVSVEGFKGEITNYGNHEGGDSFLKGLVDAEDDNWLVSNASVLKGSVQGDFTLTDKGGGDGSEDGEVGSAYVVTPTFQVDGDGTFQFKVATDLKSGDTFSAKVYQQNEDGTWALVEPLTFTISTSGNHEYTHTFNLDEGEYRISFNVDDGTSGGGAAGKASATIDVNSDLYFYGDVTYQPATGDILFNDTLGDGDWSNHDWAFAGGVEGSDGSVTVDGQYGTLVVEPDGDYTYTPDGSGGGTDTFTYTLTDVDGDSDTASLSIQVDYTVDGDSSSYAPMAMTMDAADDGGPEVLAAGFSEIDDDGEALADSVEDGAYALNSADMVVDLPDSEDFGDADAGNNTVRSFNLAHVDDGGDSLDLSDVVSGDDFSAEALDNYLSFGADDDGRAVVTIDPGGDINGDGIPDALQTITFDNVTFDELQAYGGDSDIDIIQKLLDNGNLSKDA
jgi:VCBS repeat-containing protein